MTLADLTLVLDQATVEHRQARASFDSATSAFDAARRHSPHGTDYERARSAWALAGHEWMRALVAKETARDKVAAERRRTDRVDAAGGRS